MEDFFLDIINTENEKFERDEFFKKKHIMNIIKFELAEHFKSQPERYTEPANAIYEKISESYIIYKNKAAKNGGYP